MGYLLSGNATILVRGDADGFARGTPLTIDRLPVLARISGQVLRRIPPDRGVLTPE
jgi:hypothetical protein